MKSNMLQLSSDPTFHYETLRTLSAATTNGSDVAEILQTCIKIKPADFESWYTEWFNLANQVLESIDPQKEYDNVSLRDVYFRASHYFFVSDFFLHGHPKDPRVSQTHKLWTTYYDKANALLDLPGERHNLVANGFEVPIIIYRASSSPQPRGTIIVGNGFDGSMEEMLHTIGFAALERGYNVVLYEGPGQPTVRRTQGKGFIYNWEEVVTPIVDHLQTLEFVDNQHISLLGYSMGGYLALRAAAFEHRLASCICIDGVCDVNMMLQNFVPQTMAIEDEGDEKTFDESFDRETQKSTGLRWFGDHFKFSFNATPKHAAQIARKMNIKDVVNQVTCPVFIGRAQEDQFFAGQPEIVQGQLGALGTLVNFGDEHAAGAHCQVGAYFYLAQEIFSWMSKVSQPNCAD